MREAARASWMALGDSVSPDPPTETEGEAVAAEAVEAEDAPDLEEEGFTSEAWTCEDTDK